VTRWLGQPQRGRGPISSVDIETPSYPPPNIGGAVQNFTSSPRKSSTLQRCQLQTDRSAACHSVASISPINCCLGAVFVMKPRTFAAVFLRSKFRRQHTGRAEQPHHGKVHCGGKPPDLPRVNGAGRCAEHPRRPGSSAALAWFWGSCAVAGVTAPGSDDATTRPNQVKLNSTAGLGFAVWRRSLFSKGSNLRLQ